MDKLAFGTYNHTFEKRTSYDWLTRDQAIVDQYIADPLCGYLFTIKGMADLLHLNTAANSDEWYQKVRKGPAHSADQRGGRSRGRVFQGH